MKKYKNTVFGAMVCEEDIDVSLSCMFLFYRKSEPAV